MEDSRLSRLCLIAAFGLTLLWGELYIGFARLEICDEPGHVGAAQHLAEGRPGWPSLPHLPTYHVFVNAFSLGHPSIVAARATSLVFSLLGLVAFAGVWRRLHRSEPGLPTLVFALLPILQPFTAMAYTDATAVAWLLCAWWAQLSGRYFLAGALLGVASLVRQTNVIWAAYLVAWEMLRSLESDSARPHWRVALEALWERGRWHMLHILAVALAVLVLGRFTPGTDHGNELRLNVAAFHFAGWLALLFALPVAWFYRGSLRLPRFVWLGVGVAAAVLLAVIYRNPHDWNNLLWWGLRAGTPHTLLRNWPLTQVDAHLWLRVASGILVVGAVYLLAIVFREQAHRRALWLVLPFGAILLGTNSLVDPRYYITPVVMILCLVNFERRTWLSLAGWFGLICVVHAAFLVPGKALW